MLVGHRATDTDESPTNMAKVLLDVGGAPFSASMATLTSRFARDSWFGPRFSGQFADHLEGTVFIDASPTYFPIVLAYLRDGWCALPENLFELRQLRQEAEFFNLAGLLELIDKTPATAIQLCSHFVVLFLLKRHRSYKSARVFTGVSWD